MKSEYLFLAASLALSLLACAFARGDDFPVDHAAVVRMGDSVQHTGDIEADDAAHVNSIMAELPADDAQKWFITVVGQNDDLSKRLLADWSKNESLRALAKPDDHATSWAHLNFYDVADKSQAWRFEKIKFKGFPTIIVQPPRDKSCGDPASVVCQFVAYKEPFQTPEQMTAKMVHSIKGFASQQHRNALSIAPAAPVPSGWSQRPGPALPWRVDPKPTPSTPPPSPIDDLPEIPPPSTPVPTEPFVVLVELGDDMRQLAAEAVDHQGEAQSGPSVVFFTSQGPVRTRLTSWLIDKMADNLKKKLLPPSKDQPNDSSVGGVLAFLQAHWGWLAGGVALYLLARRKAVGTS